MTRKTTFLSTKEQTIYDHIAAMIEFAIAANLQITMNGVISQIEKYHHTTLTEPQVNLVVADYHSELTTAKPLYVNRVTSVFNAKKAAWISALSKGEVGDYPSNSPMPLWWATVGMHRPLSDSAQEAVGSPDYTQSPYDQMKQPGNQPAVLNDTYII